MRPKALSLFLLFVCCATASEVLHVYTGKPWVAISQHETPWEDADHVCLNRTGIDIACGEIFYVQDKYAIVQLSYFLRETIRQSANRKDLEWVELQFKQYPPVPGDKVRLLNKNPKPQIKSLARELTSMQSFGGENFISTTEMGEKMEPYRPPLSLVGLGLQYTSPFVQYQQTITGNSAIGIKTAYLNQPIGNGFARGLGGFITYDYYSVDEFRGIWFETGLGGYGIRADQNGASSAFFTPALNTTIGWRLGWQNNLTFGFAVGGQYLLASGFQALGIDSNGFLPSILFDVGFRF